jgi:hypothetical protein
MEAATVEKRQVEKSAKNYHLDPARADQYDKMYADVLRKSLNSCDKQLVDDFNLFSGNVLADTHVSRFLLLDAIDDFLASYEVTQGWHWTNFSDAAFNYRPYQGM